MIRSCLRYWVSIATSNQIAFPFPYQYTLAPQQCKHLDPRFVQFQATQQLNQGQIQHLAYTLTNFQSFFNSSKSISSPVPYVDQQLIKRALVFKNILKENNLNAKFQINTQGCKQINGYLQYHGYVKGKYLHEYNISRSDEKIQLAEKRKILEKLSDEEQLMEDMKEIEKDNSLGQKFKENLLNKKRSKGAEVAIKIADAFNRSYQNYKKAKKFQPYILVHRIKTSMSAKLSPIDVKTGQKEQHIENIELQTKWYYEITSEEPQSIRKNRKRILFDIQMWGRGCLIPVKNFVL